MSLREYAVATIVSSAVLVSLGSRSSAELIPIGPAAFPGNSPLLTFTGLPNNLDVNGLTVAGVTFQVAVAGVPANNAVIIDGGPGVTNNISPPNVVSIVNPTAVTLTALLPVASTQFGYGYAVLSSGTIPNATTIELFNGPTSLGSLSYTATPDPGFPGGFAGVASTIAFDRAVMRFAPSPLAAAFAVDNVRFTPVPESSSMVQLSFGLIVVSYLGWLRYWFCLK